MPQFFNSTIVQVVVAMLIILATLAIGYFTLHFLGLGLRSLGRWAKRKLSNAYQRLRRAVRSLRRPKVTAGV